MRRPEVGDAVWWGAKQIGLQVTARQGGMVTAQGGGIVRTTRGREVPRYTVEVGAVNLHWNLIARCWTIGLGWSPPMPREGATVLRPLPVAVSGATRGSFASRSHGG
jgi:hypothetical protein